MNAYVGFEGYSTKSGYIHKELCIFYDNNNYDHFIFKKPDFKLNKKDMESVRFVSRQLNGLDFNDGSVPYNEIKEILKKIENYNIYTFSDFAVKTLQNYIPNASKIENIQDDGFKMPLQLPYQYCFREHRPRYCAKAKSRQIRDFIKKRGN